MTVAPTGRLRAVGAVLALAALGLGLLLPGLGGFGLWDPWERRVADDAAALAGLAPNSFAGTPSPQVRLAALGLRHFGFSEGGARLPGALIAVATLLALAGAGAALFGRRVGIAAGLVLAAMPLFVLQARQLTSDVPLLFATALALGALGRLGVETSARRRVLAGAVALAALALAAATGGVLVGVVVPCLAFTAAWLLSGSRAQAPSRRVLGWAIALTGGGLLLASLLTPYRAGQFSWLLGGAPVLGPANRGFESAFRVLGFGLYPFGALALFAVLTPLTELDQEAPAEERPRSFLTLLLVFCVVFGIAGATLQLHLIGQARLSVLPAVALLVGRWLADPGASGPANRVLGLVVAIGTLLVARDLWHAPEELVSVHLTSKVAWPPVLSLRVLFLASGVVCAAAVFARLVFDASPPRPGRWPLLASWARRASVPALLVSALLFSAGLAHGIVPALSRHLSQKRLYDTFRALSGGPRALAVYRVPASASGQFGPPDGVAFPEVGSPAALAARFREDAGAFALIPRSELAAVDDAFAEVSARYAVADASSSRFLLLAGRLPAGHPDRNPLDEIRFRAGRADGPPWERPRVPVSARYGDAVELYGADYPPAVRRPGSFPLSLYFRALDRPPAGYKIFVHVERPGQLVHGDHAPMGGTFPTERWRPGDHLRDRHQVQVPLVTAAAGLYTIYVGFWPGGNSVRRLPVTAGEAHDGRDRIALGTIRVN